MKQVQVKNLKGEIVEIIKVKKAPLCLCGKEMYIYEHVDGLREWRCEDKCMGELIRKCVCCEDWVYEDVCCPEDFDPTLGLTFMLGHRHCMEEQAKELRQKREQAPKYFWKLKDASKYEEVYHIINVRTMTDVYHALKTKLGSDKFYLYRFGFASDGCCEYHIMSGGEAIGKLHFNESGLLDYQHVILFPRKIR